MTTTGTRRTRIERRRLLARIAADVDEGSDILVLSAAPGSGKTTLLEQWLGQRRAAGEIVVVLSAGRSDGSGDLHPALREGIREAAPAWCASALSQALDDLVNGRATELSPTVTHDRTRPPVWVMLDDVQQWTSSLALEQIARLLAGAGPDLRIAIGGRYTVHGLLSEMLLDGRAVEYRLADLAFDDDEARELLATEGIELAATDLTVLLERTAGWAAGLRLAALAMARHDDHAAFVRTFAGTDRSVGDYLVSAVLSGLPADRLDILLDVSPADRVNVDLARLLAGRPDAGAILDELVEQNLLVSTVRHESDWYVLHPLLRTYLRAASRRRDEARYRRRQATTIDWFEAAGDARRAIQHAAAAADWPRLEALIDSSCVHVVMVDGPAALREIWRTLPGWLQSRPSVAAAASLIALLEGNPEAAELELSVLDAAEDDASRRLALRAIASLAGSRTRPMTRRSVADALASLDTAVEADADLAILGRSQATMALAMAGDLEGARATGGAVIKLCRTRGLDYTLLRTLIAKATVSAFQSDFDGVVVHGEEALELAHRRGWCGDPRLTSVHGQLAVAAWLRFDDDAAAEHARRAVEIADAEADPVSAAAAQCQLDIMAIAPRSGLDLRVVGHFRAFNELWPLLPPVVVLLNACFELLISLRFHELELAGEIIRRVEEVVPESPDVAVLRSMRHVYQGHHHLARQELDAVLADADDFMTPWITSVGWALAAHVADAAGEPARTHDALARAIQVAEPAGLMRLVLDVTPALRGLLVEGTGRFGRYESFVADALAKVEVDRPSQGNGIALTEKELMVLRDLPSMLSLREIAEAHVVSVNTIKTHMKSVYRKLGVVSRREAVDSARRLGLI